MPTRVYTCVQRYVNAHTSARWSCCIGAPEGAVEIVVVDMPQKIVLREPESQMLELVRDTSRERAPSNQEAATYSTPGALQSFGRECRALATSSSWEMFKRNRMGTCSLTV